MQKTRRWFLSLSALVLLLAAAQPGLAAQLFGVTSGGGPATFGNSAVSFTGSGSDDLRTIDPATGTAATVGALLPSGMHSYNSALDTPGDRYFYVTSAGLHVADSTTGALIATHALAPNVAGLEYDPASGLLYVVALGMGPGTFGNSALVLDGSGANDFVSIDPGTGTVTVLSSTLPSGLRNFGAALDSAGGRYFYLTASELHVVDLATGAVLDSLALPDNVHGLRFDPVTGLLYGVVLGLGPGVFSNVEMAFSGDGDNDFVSIDPTTGLATVAATNLPSGSQNFAAALDPAAGEFYYRTGGSLVTVALATGAVTTTVAAPDNFYALEAPFLPVPPVLVVAIDIKPGNSQNTINPGSNGVIQVAVLTTSVADGDAVDFDAADVDPATVAFGPGGATPVNPIRLKDVDHDGDADLLLHFSMPAAAIPCGATTASLTGATFAAQLFTGTDAVRTVGCH